MIAESKYKKMFPPTLYEQFLAYRSNRKNLFSFLLGSLLLVIGTNVLQAQTCTNLDPVTLPFEEGFENLSNVSFTTTGNLCTPFNEAKGKWSFETTGGPGQFGNTAPINNGGEGALLLDGSGAKTASLTLNMANYNVATDVFLSFDFYDANDETAANDRVWIRGSEEEDWIEIYNWQEQAENQWLTSPELNLSTTLSDAEQAFSTTFQIRFGQSGSYAFSTDGLLVDNIFVTTCARPSDATIITNTETTATIGWTNTGTATSWNIEWGEVGFTKGEGTLVSDISSNPYILEGLSAGTLYEGYIQSDCGDIVSGWEGPLSISTLCPSFTPAQLPYVEDFEDVSAITFTKDATYCTPERRWDYHQTEDGMASFGYDQNWDRHYLRLNSSYRKSGTSDAILTLDLSNYTTDNNLFFKFDFYDDGDSPSEQDSIWVRGNMMDEWIGFYSWQNMSQRIWHTSPLFDIDAILSAEGQNPSNSFQIRFGQGNSVSTYNGLYLDNITITNCAAPDNLSTDNATLTSTTLLWNQRGSVDSWDIEWGLKSFVEGNGTLVSNIVSPSYSLTNLVGGIPYDFYVRGNCNGTPTEWIGPYHFSALCPTLTPITLPYGEDFKNVTKEPVYSYQQFCIADGQLELSPSNGSFQVVSTSVPERTEFLHSSINDGGVNEIIFSYDMSNYTGIEDLFLAFDFYYRTYEGEERDSKAWIRGSSLNQWVEFYDWPEGELDEWVNSTEIDIADILQENGQDFSETFQIRFEHRKNPENYSLTLLIANLNLSTCIKPSIANLTEVNSNEFNLTWIENGIATQWDLEWGETGFEQGTASGTLLTELSTTSYSFSNLPPNTTYDVYIRSNCGSESSKWIKTSFISNCEALSPTTLPFIEDFESIGSQVTQEDKVLYCDNLKIWEYRGVNAVASLGAEFGNDDSRGLRMQTIDLSAKNEAILTLDLSNYSTATNLFLTFDFNHYNTSDNLDKVWIRGDNTNAWIELYDWGGETSRSTWHLSPTLDIAAALTAAEQSIGSSFQINFIQGGYPSNERLSIDNISITTCAKPAALSASVSSNSAVLNWTENGAATAWDIEWGVVGFTSGSGNLITAHTMTNYTLSNLSEDIDYEFYVRANCGDNTSFWAGPYRFTTLCNTFSPLSLPYLEDFEDLSSARLINQQLCTATRQWGHKADVGGYADFGTFSARNNGGGGALEMGGSRYTIFNETILTLDLSNYTSANDLFLTFDLYYEYNNHLNDSVWVRGSSFDPWVGLYDWNEGTRFEWHTSPEFDIVTSLETVGQTVSSSFQIRFGQGSADNEFYIDNILLTNCAKPSDGMATTTTTTATLNWVESGMATNWDVEWGVSGFNLGNGTLLEVEATPSQPLANLSIGTAYEFYVRSDCGNSKSPWAGPFSFATLCPALSPISLPFLEDFENITNATYSSGARICFNDKNWDYENQGRGYATFGNGYLYMRSGGINDAILTLDMSNHTGRSDVYLTFDFYDSNSSLSENDTVWVRGSSADDWVFIYDWEGKSNYNWVTTPELSIESVLNPVGQDFSSSFQIRFGQGGTYGLNIDNIRLIDCLKPTDLSATNLLETEVELNWTENGTATTWDIEWMEKGFPLGEGNLLTGITQKPYPLTKLPPETTYDFYVRSDCGETESPWVGPYTFSTTPTVRVLDAVTNEGDEGETTMTFEVILSSLYPSDISISYQTLALSATDGEDYIGVNGTVIIPAGKATTSIPVQVIGDLKPENNENLSMSIRILPVTNFVDGVPTPELGDGLALGFILDDDFDINDENSLGIIDYSRAVCGTELLLDGTPLISIQEGSWSIHSSSTVPGHFSDEAIYSSAYYGRIGSIDTLLWTITANNNVLKVDTIVAVFSPDSDFDGTQDCIDLCLGGDDRIDGDGDGVPKDCDCDDDDPTDSFVVINENNPSSSSESYRLSSNKLISKEALSTGIDVTYHAGQEITLIKGFHAPAGTNFLAELGPCTNEFMVEKILEHIPAEERQTITEEANNFLEKTETKIKDTALMDLLIQPNLVRNQALIYLALPQAETVSLYLYNQNGQLMKTLFSGVYRSEGTHSFVLQAGYLPNGLYLLQARGAKGIVTKKLVVQRF